MIPLVIGISVLSYAIIVLAPGDPAKLLADPEKLTAESYISMRAELGLDDPGPVRYVKTMSSLFTGELRSFRTQQRVVDAIGERLPTSLSLGILAILFGLLFGTLIGVVQAIKPYSRVDDIGTLLSLTGFSLPHFWFALMLVLLFGVRLRWLPSSGIRPVTSSSWNPLEMAPYLVMPTIVLGTGLLAYVARFVRSSMLDALGQDYVRTARSKGLHEVAVIVRHVLRNSLLPVITIAGFLLPLLIGGAVVVEYVFALPGMGRLAVDAVFARDYPVILTITIFSSIAVIFGNLIADVLYAVAAPRVFERAGPPPRRRGLMLRMAGNERVVVGCSALLAALLAAVFATQLAPYDPNAQVLATRFGPPSFAHLFGTDQLGRDVLSRAIWGSRVSLGVGFSSVLITIVIGTAIGIAAGYGGGWIDGALMRFVDVVISIPVFMLLLTIVAIYGSNVPLLITFIGLSAFPGAARIVRAEVLSLMPREFITASRVIGSSPWRIMVRHILPNLLPIIVVSATLRVGAAILTEAGLSYFGLGVPPPAPTWGGMVADGRTSLDVAWWVSTFPGVALLVVVIATNLVGDGLRDVFDPRRAHLA